MMNAQTKQPSDPYVQKMSSMCGKKVVTPDQIRSQIRYPSV